ncbi:multicopper oxidase family protein [Phycicoccus sp. SLBN-51]|uniref:multicopper oxidase family protein n=1 Tax=Phycicoccus sp. SLBN-51 TaxID=2768447 RepID=UPI00114DD116|nr:multicopper oxidase family protein [Phycicoccus sp. SLBN-51]TQJ52155.1 FtsP/CotA-like multicopper oxidase with cupredoxin domain [Phycicoccus sp. SLBN-51]
MNQISRRSLLLGSAAGALTLAGLGACSGRTPVGSTAESVRRAEEARRVAGQRVVTARLAPEVGAVDLGGLSVNTWTYGGTLPGPLLRATAGDLLRVEVENALPTETSVHWHGVALRNDMDGVPGMTQRPIGAGQRFLYEFTAPDPGTYFYHPHTGVQLDRGLYGVLVVEDPQEKGDYDLEWVVVLDDWVDGTGRTPDDVLAAFRAASGNGSGGMGHGGMGGMGGMDHGSTGGMGMGGMGMGGAMSSSLLGGAGDVAYPHYLVNGRVPASPVTLRGKPGQRVRLRIVNAGSDTAFRVALGGHRMTVTHTDGFPVQPAETGALLVGMGERYDVLVTLSDGVFPLVALAEGKSGQGLAVVRTSAGSAPAASVRPAELDGVVTTAMDLLATEDARLPEATIDRRHDLLLSGSMAPYRWTINGATFEDAEPLEVHQSERVQLRFRNMSMMFHPMHVHGHTFALQGNGVRKDTLIVRPMQGIVVDLQAANPGQWATHCHNIYHAEAGMMTTLSYRS